MTRPGCHGELAPLLTALAALVPGVRPSANASVLMARVDADGYRAALGWVYPGLHGRGEDAAWLSLQALACCDGAAGHPYGDLAARLARDAVAGAGSDVVSGLANAQASILAHQRRHVEAQDMATTLTALAAAEGILSVAHMGDGAAWLWRRGCLMLLTEHHAVSRPGYGHEEWVLTGYLGGDGAPPDGPQIAHWDIDAGDVVLVCSAGLAWHAEALAARLAIPLL